jgi:heme/copper-type cytochrome/quinol oxidase subunit 4
MDDKQERKQRKLFLGIVCILLVAAVTLFAPLIVFAMMKYSGDGEITAMPLVITMIIVGCIDIAIVAFFNWRMKYL